MVPNTLYVSNKRWEAFKGCLQPQTWQHGIIYIPQLSRIAKSDLAFSEYESKGALTCSQTSLKGTSTLYMCPIWRREAFTCLQLQTWKYGIIYIPQWSRIAKIWPSLIQVTEQGCTPLIYSLTSLKGANTLYMCSIWMQEAIKGNLQPQTSQHGITCTWQGPRIAKSDLAMSK